MLEATSRFTANSKSETFGAEEKPGNASVEWTTVESSSGQRFIPMDRNGQADGFPLWRAAIFGKKEPGRRSVAGFD